MAQPTILLVDDEKEIIDMLAIYLKMKVISCFEHLMERKPCRSFRRKR